MKLLMVNNFFESHRGGIDIVAGRLVREFARLGLDIVWLATDASPPPELPGCRAVQVPANNWMEDRLGVPFPVPTLRAARIMWREVRRADAVFMHDAWYLTSVIAFLAARRYGKATLVLQHIGAVPYRNPVLRALMAIGNRVVARPLLARADRVVFYSEIAARYFATVRFAAKPEWLFNGVDTELYRPADGAVQKAELRARFGLPADRPAALFVGRFVEKKGLHILARMARLRPEVHWALAGWGPIDPLAWRLPNVSVFGDLAGATLAPLYQACDIFALPSTGEGFPLVVQEALACGLPVVCGADTAGADHAATPLLVGVEVGQNDLDRTAAEFCAAMDRVLADPSAQEAHAAERHRFATEHYAWSAAARRYVELLEAVAGRRRSRPEAQPESSVNRAAPAPGERPR